jgi:beta-N-acetylhexosaminidase
VPVLGPVVLDVEGPRLTAADRDRLRHPLVGMVILFARNYRSPAELAELTGEIHALRDPSLIIAVDHEGGRVQRFREAPFTRIPAMAELGRLWDKDVLLACRSAASAGFVMASELRAFGVDLTFAPVLDLEWKRSGVIGDRSLHADARVVTLLASQLCHGMALAGMANCGKHFPGHGWAEADSHTHEPTDERSQRAIAADDMAPYGWLGTTLASVMPAHVIYPRVDRLPAGFSRRWIHDILRGELGFTGAIFSDDLTMEGAKIAGSVVNAGQMAIDAGCDFVLVCNSPQKADELLNGLRWSSSPGFEERLARMQPRGEALPIDRLQASSQYRQAVDDVARWAARLG